MSGIAGVHARIGEIQSRFGVAATMAQSASFSAALRRATDARPSAVPAPAAAAQTGAARPAVFAAPLAGSTRPATTPAGAAAGAPPGWAARLPEAGQRWASAIEEAATKAGVDPRLLASLVRAESGFQPGARSHAGAIGLAQLMPATARGLGVDPHDPAQNLAGGARFLKAMLDKFGTVELALAAYNAGPGRVAQAGGIPNITETQNYVRRVTAYYHELKGVA